MRSEAATILGMFNEWVTITALLDALGDVDHRVRQGDDSCFAVSAHVSLRSHNQPVIDRIIFAGQNLDTNGIAESIMH